MNNWFCINKSGKSVPVYSDPDKTKKIGTIYNREAFGYFKNWGGDDVVCYIVFLNSSGTLTNGFLVNPPDNSRVPCTNYPYGTKTIYGTKYYTFKLRKSRTVYTVKGNKWGTVAAGRRVACLTALAGDTKAHWKGINYVENSSGGWDQVTGDGSSYGFVDTGLGVSSGYDSIPFYGSW